MLYAYRFDVAKAEMKLVLLRKDVEQLVSLLHLLCQRG